MAGTIPHWHSPAGSQPYTFRWSTTLVWNTRGCPTDEFAPAGLPLRCPDFPGTVFSVTSGAAKCYGCQGILRGNTNQFLHRASFIDRVCSQRGRPLGLGVPTSAVAVSCNLHSSTVSRAWEVTELFSGIDMGHGSRFRPADFLLAGYVTLPFHGRKWKRIALQLLCWPCLGMFQSLLMVSPRFAAGLAPSARRCPGL